MDHIQYFFLDFLKISEILNNIKKVICWPNNLKWYSTLILYQENFISVTLRERININAHKIKNGKPHTAMQSISPQTK